MQISTNPNHKIYFQVQNQVCNLVFLTEDGFGTNRWRSAFVGDEHVFQEGERSIPAPEGRSQFRRVSRTGKLSLQVLLFRLQEENVLNVLGVKLITF